MLAASADSSPGVDVANVENKALTSISSIGLLGCAAAMNAWRTATNYVRAHPAMKSASGVYRTLFLPSDINDVVIHSLFGDRLRGVGDRRQPGFREARARQGGDPQ